MTIHATVTDLRARYLGTIKPTQDTIAETLLDDAWSIITDQLPSLPGRLQQDPDGTLLTKVIRVQCAMVGRVLSNPNGYLQEAIDDYSYRRDSAVSAGKLYLADDELDLLTANRARRGGAYSIRTA